MLQTESEASLLRQARNFDEESLTAIFDQFAPSIFKFAARLSPDITVADEIVQDVFGTFLENMATGKGPRTNLRVFLYQTAYQRVTFRIRERHISPQFDEVREKQGGKSQGARELEDLMSAMNSKLTDDQFYVIIFRFLEDFSLKETAEIIGKDVNNIKVIQNRGMAKLTQALGYTVEGEE